MVLREYILKYNLEYAEAVCYPTNYKLDKEGAEDNHPSAPIIYLHHTWVPTATHHLVKHLATASTQMISSLKQLSLKLKKGERYTHKSMNITLSPF